LMHKESKYKKNVKTFFQNNFFRYNNHIKLQTFLLLVMKVELCSPLTNKY
jgi:hypothetical protein